MITLSTREKEQLQQAFDAIDKRPAPIHVKIRTFIWKFCLLPLTQLTPGSRQNGLFRHKYGQKKPFIP